MYHSTTYRCSIGGRWDQAVEFHIPSSYSFCSTNTFIYAAWTPSQEKLYLVTEINLNVRTRWRTTLNKKISLQDSKKELHELWDDWESWRCVAFQVSIKFGVTILKSSPWSWGHSLSAGPLESIGMEKSTNSWKDGSSFPKVSALLPCSAKRGISSDAEDKKMTKVQWDREDEMVLQQYMDS